MATSTSRSVSPASMSDGTVAHIALLTRFSLRSQRFMKAAGIGDEADRTRWFALRAALFKSITLPSVRAQSLRPTMWYLFMADGDQPLFEQYIGMQDDWIRPIYLAAGASVGRYCQTLLAEEFDVQNELFVGRLDNDDAVHKDYFKLGVEASRRDAIHDDHYVIFTLGCRWDGSKIQLLEYPNNPFLTVCSRQWLVQKPNPLGIDHTTVREHKHLFVESPDGRPMWMQTLHGANASNKFLPDLNIEAADFERLRQEFSIRAESLDAIQANRHDWAEIGTVENAATPPTHPVKVTPPAAAQGVVARPDGKTARPRRLNAVRAIIGATSYLEIGVATGATFFAVDASRKVGVDVKFAFDVNEQRDPRATFFQMKSNDYFCGPGSGEKFDLVFVDGLHTFEQTLIDFHASLLSSHAGSAIIVDDTLPNDVYGSLTDRRQAFDSRRRIGNKSLAWHGDVFKLIIYIHDFLPMLSYCTFNTGGNPQTLIWREHRASYKPVFGNLEKISRLDYFWLMDNLRVLNPLPEPEALARFEAWAHRRGT